MPAILQKTLVKWSTIAILGLGAYFLGYFWGIQQLEPREPQRQTASDGGESNSSSEKAADFGQLK